MAERKVIQKYYHPEFDPSQVPRRKVPTTNQVKIRMMLPMTIQCSVCGEFMYQGKKFNSRKETVQGEEYLGLKVFRFYIRCTRCASEVTFKTDPKNSGYVPEHNCLRSYPAKSNGSDEVSVNDDEDAMKKLESKTLDSKQELEDLDVLDSIKTIKQLQNKISSDKILEKLQAQIQEEIVEEEFNEEELEEINDFYKPKRIYLDEEEDDNAEASSSNPASNNEESFVSATISEHKKRDSSFISDLGTEVKVIKKKRKKTKIEGKSALSSLSYLD